MDIKLILIFAAIIAAIWIYIVVREKINLRRAATGEDKERLRRAVSQALPGENGYQVAYGHYEDVQHYGRKKITTYYRYALAFDASRIWVMPLQFDKDLILPGEPVLINADTLGVADVKITDDKEGKPRRVDLALYDKGGTSLFNCVVEVQNTREDSYHHVNILQEDECARFGRLMDSIAAQVNRNNPGMKEQVRTTETYSRKAYVRGIFGGVFGVFFPPVGLYFSITGLRLAKKVRIGNELTAPLVMCRIGLVISIIFALLEGGILIYTWLTNGGLGG